MTAEELDKIAEDERESSRNCRHRLHVCVAAGCLSLHSDQVKNSLEAQIKASGLESECRVKGVGCMGLCSAGPLVSVSSQDVTYQDVAPEDAPEIVQGLQAGKPVERLRFAAVGGTTASTPKKLGPVAIGISSAP